MSALLFERFERNTFRIDYSAIPVKPSTQEILDFSQEIAGQEERYDLVQMNIAKGVVYVTMPTLEKAQMAVDKHAKKHFLKHDGKNYPVLIEMEDGATEVRVRDLPPLFPDESIAAELKQFGEVMSITKGVWGPETRLAGVPSGVRIVKMKLKKPIASFVTTS